MEFFGTLAGKTTKPNRTYVYPEQKSSTKPNKHATTYVASQSLWPPITDGVFHTFHTCAQERDVQSSAQRELSSGERSNLNSEESNPGLASSSYFLHIFLEQIEDDKNIIQLGPLISLWRDAAGYFHARFRMYLPRQDAFGRCRVRGHIFLMGIEQWPVEMRMGMRFSGSGICSLWLASEAVDVDAVEPLPTVGYSTIFFVRTEECYSRLLST